MSFQKAEHTIILSDIHLADTPATESHKHHLWKKFKSEEYFIDQDFKELLQFLHTQSAEPIELICNGDTFDFDSVMALPTDPEISISFLERKRGLNSEEKKSEFKMQCILDAHPVWIEALRMWLQLGHRIIFIVGNHDLELHWPKVKQALWDRVLPDISYKDQMQFCEWFYVSNQDTLVEHGNQYDAYCVCLNPIYPLIRKGHRILVRLPFGNLAARYMINGIGLLNPHTGSFIQDSFLSYLKFYYQYMIKVQPLILWTWFWSACITLLISLSEGFLPALKDPKIMGSVDQHIKNIARRSNTNIINVMLLKENQVHSATFNPFKVLKELWLDRTIFLVGIFFVSFQIISILNYFFSISYMWLLLPLALFMPFFIFYARSVISEVIIAQEAAYDMSPLSAQILGVNRIIHGHTHIEKHIQIGEFEIINTGTWSPAFHDIECTKPYGQRCFAWVHPHPDGKGRVAQLFEWKDQKPLLMPKTTRT